MKGAGGNNIGTIGAFVACLEAATKDGKVARSKQLAYICENVIKEWLLKTFADTVFNTCEHQPLPFITEEPLRIYVDPNAKPVVVHNPASIPIHWRERVKEDLDWHGVLRWLQLFLTACKNEFWIIKYF